MTIPVTLEELTAVIECEGAAEDWEERIYLSGRQLAEILYARYNITHKED